MMPGLRIAILNILGDTELVTACSKALAEKIKQVDYDVVVTAETKSIPLAHALAVETGKPYAILRKSYKPYMGTALQAETLSITTGEPQTLYLDEKDRALMTGKKVIILDDVISTGSTLQDCRGRSRNFHGRGTRPLAGYRLSWTSACVYRLNLGFVPGVLTWMVEGQLLWVALESACCDRRS
jgi:hypothetical protein